MMTPDRRASAITIPTNSTSAVVIPIEFAKVHIGVCDARNVRINEMPAIEHVYSSAGPSSPGAQAVLRQEVGPVPRRR